MEYEGPERAVFEALRSRELQRLRLVRQNGLASLVYPGAEHTRFAHSLGASHIASNFARRLRLVGRGVLTDEFIPDDLAIQDLALAALCHDLGHGPLSHAWEREVIGEFRLRDWAPALGLDSDEQNLRGLKWHELVTQGLLAWEDGALHGLLESHERTLSDRIRYMLLGQYHIPFLPRLLRSDIDVDRSDYILRDAFHTGVSYKYDLPWLISCCRIGFDARSNPVFGLDASKAVRVTEQFLTARRALYENVYYHKGVRSAEAMAALFLRRLREVVRDGRLTGMPAMLTPVMEMLEGKTVGLQEILRLNDSTFWVLVDESLRSENEDLTLRDLARRLLSRDLFTTVPVESKSIRDYIDEHPGYPRLYEIISRFSPGLSSSYLHIDKIEFEMFGSRPDECAFFISNGDCSEIRHHPKIRNMWSGPDVEYRIYTIREASDAIKQEIESS